MEAIAILKNENNNHRLIQIDLDMLASNQAQLADVYDIIAVEFRKNEETVPWEQVNNIFIRKANYNYVSHSG